MPGFEMRDGVGAGGGTGDNAGTEKIRAPEERRAFLARTDLTLRAPSSCRSSQRWRNKIVNFRIAMTPDCSRLLEKRPLYEV